MLQRELKIENQRGLHARASAKFVQCVERFNADVWVTKDGQTVDGNSIMGLMLLAASTGSMVQVVAEGLEAEAALDALQQLLADKFGEV